MYRTWTVPPVGGKGMKKKRKKKKGKHRNLKHSKRGSKIVPYMKSQSLVLLKLINNDNLSHPCQRVTWKGRESKRPIDTKGMFGWGENKNDGK